MNCGEKLMIFLLFNCRKILNCLENTKHGVVLSTDNYFRPSSSDYHYDVAKLSQAHEWNKNKGKIIFSF